MEYARAIFEILGALGAIGTFGAFLFLFKKDKHKQQQIDKLTNITEQLTNVVDELKRQNGNMLKQVEISVLPELWTNGISLDANGTDFKIDLSNRGEIAKLVEFRLDSEDIILHNEHLPQDLLKGENRWIFCKSKGIKRHEECNYTIQVIYSNKINNEYILEIEPTKNGIPVIVKDEKKSND